MAEHGDIEWQEWDSVNESSDFCCPECGGKYFGTGPSPEYYKDPRNFDIDKNRHGHCNSSFFKLIPETGYWQDVRCGFIWPRSEDHKYFIQTKIRRPK